MFDRRRNELFPQAGTLVRRAPVRSYDQPDHRLEIIAVVTERERASEWYRRYIVSATAKRFSSMHRRNPDKNIPIFLNVIF